MNLKNIAHPHQNKVFDPPGARGARKYGMLQFYLHRVYVNCWLLYICAMLLINTYRGMHTLICISARTMAVLVRPVYLTYHY